MYEFLNNLLLHNSEISIIYNMFAKTNRESHANRKPNSNYALSAKKHAIRGGRGGAKDYRNQA